MNSVYTFALCCMLILSCTSVNKSSTIVKDSILKNDSISPAIEINESTIDTNYLLPKPLTVSSSVGGNAITDNFTKEIIHIIGWNTEGNLAYLKEGAYEASEGHDAELIIFNPSNNKIIDKQKWANDHVPDYTFEPMWNENKNSFIKLLKKHKINYSNNTEIKSPIIINGNTFSTKNKYEEYEGTNSIVHTQIYTKKDGKINLLFEKKTQADIRILTNEIKGYIISPDGKHAALLFAEERRGWEGPPNVMLLSFVGFEVK